MNLASQGVDFGLWTQGGVTCELVGCQKETIRRAEHVGREDYTSSQILPTSPTETAGPPFSTVEKEERTSSAEEEVKDVEDKAFHVPNEPHCQPVR